MNKSEQINNSSYSYCSLCEQCRKENITRDPIWSCRDEDKTPFIKNKNFLEDISLFSRRQSRPDCIYKYDESKIIVIEIKDQKIESIDAEPFIKKIKNSYKVIADNNMKFKAFILQVSSIENSSKGHFQMLSLIEALLNKYHFKLYKDNLLSHQKLGRIAKFFIKKCKDIDEHFFDQICL